MHPILRNALAVIGGIVVGMVVNMGLVTAGPAIVPLPEGADVSSMEALRDSMELFTPANFIFPFLGHALGTLAGASLPPNWPPVDRCPSLWPLVRSSCSVASRWCKPWEVPCGSTWRTWR